MLGLGTAPLATMLSGLYQSNDLGNGVFTITAVVVDPSLKRPGDFAAAPLEPAQNGDVMSCQPGGGWQTRPPGANGVYERCTIAGSLVTYNPEGGHGPAYTFLLPSIANE